MGIRRWLRELTASAEELAVLRAADAAVPITIADAAEEVTVRIAGVISAAEGELLRAPLSQRPCVWW
jgi:hypothetical protein